MPFEKLIFETNFYYSIIKDGLGNTPKIMNEHVESKVRPGEYINAFYYGSYYKGNNMGLETVIRYLPTSDIVFELSHSWFNYNLEFQENNDFDITTIPDKQKDLVDEKYPQIPQHILRAKAYYTLAKTLKLSVSGLYATAFNVKTGTITPTYSYEKQRFDPLYADGGNQVQIGGKFDNRLILNFKIEKLFIDNKLSVYLFGSDVTSAPFVEGVNQLETAYPRQVGGMYGFGLKFQVQ